MGVMAILTPFLGGLGLFIYAMQVLASGLENAAGNKLKKLLQSLIKNRFMGVLLGFIVTAIVQSSSTTTVMVVGFVNSGIMNLSQAMGVIMGANIGTTVTGWLVASGEWASWLDPRTYAPIAIAFGVFMMLLSRKKMAKDISNVILGFGMLMVGISTMSAAVSPLRENEAVQEMFIYFGENPLLGILAGAVVTIIVFSSTASVGILQSLAVVGLVPFNAAIYIIMGQNIGTTVTTLISSFGAKKTAKAAAFMHLLFSVIGTIIFAVFAYFLFNFIAPWLNYQSISQTEIILAHTLFNIGTAVIIFPFAEKIVKLAKKIFKIEEVEIEDDKVHLDDRVLETPGIALQASVFEISRMGKLVTAIMDKARDVVFSENKECIKEIRSEEQVIDELCDDISNYLIKISSKTTSEEDNKQVADLLSVVSDIERISDCCENISESITHLSQIKDGFSDVAIEELKEMAAVCADSYKSAIEAFSKNDKEQAKRTIELERKADELEEKMRAAHMKRLTKKTCNNAVGMVFLDTIVNLERISDHSRNIAEVVLDY